MSPMGLREKEDESETFPASRIFSLSGRRAKKTNLAWGDASYQGQFWAYGGFHANYKGGHKQDRDQ